MPNGKLSMARMAVIAGAGLAGFWLGDVGMQFALEALPAVANSLNPSMPQTDITSILPSILAANPLGVSTERLPLAFGAFASIALIAGSQMRKAEDPSKAIRLDEVNGSQAFATVKARAKYAHSSERGGWAKPDWAERVEDDNLLLSQNSKIAATGNPDYSIEQLCPNRHVFVMAGSGSGKTHTFVKPNILQMLGSYVCSDPKGELFSIFARFLEAHGYEVAVLNLRDEAHMRGSCRYNPLEYCDDITAINAVVEMFIENTKGEDSSGDQMYFINMERSFYVAIIGLFVFWFKANGNKRDCTLPAIIDYLIMAKETGENGMSNLDVVFYGDPSIPGFTSFRDYIVSKYPDRGEAALNDDDVPEAAVLKSYEMFKSAAGDVETMSNVVSSCASRLTRFNNPAIRELLSEDELDLRSMGKRKRALFLCTKDEKGAYDFISAMVYNQLFSVNVDIADASPGRHLDVPLWCFMDELANIGKIPNLEKLFATCRSRWINLVAIVQNGKQLKSVYGQDKADFIRSNAAIFAYLGGALWEDCKELSEQMGRTTRVSKSYSKSTSATGTSVTEQVQVHEVPLMRPEELFNYNEETGEGFPADSVITHYMRSNWFIDKKCDPARHPRWAELQRIGETDYDAWSRERRARVGHAGLRSLPAPGETTIDPDAPGTFVLDAG